MSTLALIEVQKALYAALHADGVLMGMVEGIFDAVPQKSEVPYIVIGEGNEALQAVADGGVSECHLTLQVWTQASGRKTALMIMNRIHALLHLGSLSVDGFEVLVLRTEQASVRLAEDGNYMNGSLTLALTVEEA